MKEDIHGHHFLITLGYEYLKKKFRAKKEIFDAYQNVKDLHFVSSCTKPFKKEIPGSLYPTSSCSRRSQKEFQNILHQDLIDKQSET